MKKYESIIIIDPKLEEKEIKGTIEKYQNLMKVTDANGNGKNTFNVGETFQVRLPKKSDKLLRYLELKQNILQEYNLTHIGI